MHPFHVEPVMENVSRSAWAPSAKLYLSRSTCRGLSGGIAILKGQARYENAFSRKWTRRGEAGLEPRHWENFSESCECPLIQVEYILSLGGSIIRSGKIILFAVCDNNNRHKNRCDRFARSASRVTYICSKYNANWTKGSKAKKMLYCIYSNLRWSAIR